MQSPDVHPSCNTGADCGNRQDCFKGTCQCIINWGYTGFPACDQRTKHADVYLAYGVVLGVCGLFVAYLHMVTLVKHVRMGLNEAVTNKFRHMLVRLLCYKGLYCLLSLVFLLLPIINRVRAVSFLLGRPMDTSRLTSPNGPSRRLTALSFIAMAWAYIIMGNLWLSMAAKLGLGNDRLTRFARPCLRPLLSWVLAILPLFSALSFLSVTGGFSEQLKFAAFNLLPVGLLATSFLVLAASIMIPVLRRRVVQVQKTVQDDGDVADTLDGMGPSGRYATSDEGTDPRVLRRMLRKYVKRRFTPQLDRISEAAHSALERSASTSLVGGPPVLPHQRLGASTSLHAPQSPGHTTQGASKAKGPITAAAPSTIEAAEEDTPSGTQQPGGPKNARERVLHLKALTHRIGFTALRLAMISVLSSAFMFLGSSGVARSVQTQDINAAVLYNCMVLTGYPAVHMWGNLLCLLLVSNRARDALQPLKRAVRCVLECIVTLCSMEQDECLQDLADLPPDFLEPQGAQEEHKGKGKGKQATPTVVVHAI